MACQGLKIFHKPTFHCSYQVSASHACAQQTGACASMPIGHAMASCTCSVLCARKPMGMALVVNALGASQDRPAIGAPATRNGSACPLIRRYARALISARSRCLKDAERCACLNRPAVQAPAAALPGERQARPSCDARQCPLARAGRTRKGPKQASAYVGTMRAAATPLCTQTARSLPARFCWRVVYLHWQVAPASACLGLMQPLAL